MCPSPGAPYICKGQQRHPGHRTVQHSALGSSPALGAWEGGNPQLRGDPGDRSYRGTSGQNLGDSGRQCHGNKEGVEAEPCLPGSQAASSVTVSSGPPVPPGGHVENQGASHSAAWRLQVPPRDLVPPSFGAEQDRAMSGRDTHSMRLVLRKRCPEEGTSERKGFPEVSHEPLG